jgi:hypothetical protein
VRAAEQSIVAARFGGSRSAYRAALAQAKVSLAVARSVIVDELRRARISARFRVAAPSGEAIAEFQQTYGELKARLVQSAGRVQWLGGRKLGYAVESNAPGALMSAPTLRWTSVWSATGAVRVRPLGPPVPLASVPLGRLRASIRAAIIAQEREATCRRSGSPTSRTTCRFSRFRRTRGTHGSRERPSAS